MTKIMVSFLFLYNFIKYLIEFKNAEKYGLIVCSTHLIKNVKLT